MLSTEPETSEEPEASTEPETSEAPVVPTEPEASAEPVVPTEPETTAEPEATATQEASQEPSLAAAPMLSAGPALTSRPAATNAVDPQLETVSLPAANDGDSNGDTTDENATGRSVLQQRIDKILTGKLSGTVQLILERNTTFEGNAIPGKPEDGKIVIDASDREIDKNFALELIAEDAGDTGTEGEGFTIINADLLIKGIKVIMKSVMMAADKKIEVRNEDAAGDNNGKAGELIYEGTSAAINDVNVKVGVGGTATINTFDNEDSITAETEADANKLTINAGEGLNSVNVTVGGGAVEIVTGSSNDTLNLTIKNPNEGVHVDTGASTDYVTIVNNASAKDPLTWVDKKDDKGNVVVDADGNPVQEPSGGLYVNTGAGDDQITLDVRANAGDMTIDTGLGSAAVTVLKGDSYSAENLDYNANYNYTEATRASDDVGAKITFKNSDGSAQDRFTVDANAGLAVSELHFEGGKGATVHFRGKLATSLPEGKSNPMGYIVDNDPSNGFKMSVSSVQDNTDSQQKVGLALKITYDDLDKMNFTDTLKNKKRVEVYTPTTNTPNTFTVTANDDFTDYVIKPPVNTGINKIVVQGSKKLMLSNLVFDADELGADSPYIPSIQGAGGGYANLNVLIKAPTININKAIKAQNVRAESALGSLTLFGLIMEAAQDFSLSNIAGNLYSAADSAVINVNAPIETAQDIALVARVKHFGPLFPGLPSALDIINVKIANAEVNINALSGVGKTLNAGGNVLAQAKIETSMGYSTITDPDGTRSTFAPDKNGGPVGIDVVVNNAAVNVAQNAVVEAAQDVTLAASSNVRVYNYANYGAFSAPLALVVTSVTNKVNVIVDGVVTAGRKVKLDAAGSVTDDTNASFQSGTAAQGYGVGGFVAVNVVDQDVNSIIAEHAKVTAHTGDVSVYTSQVAQVDTVATAGGDKVVGQSSPAVASAINLFKALGGILWNKFKDSIVNKQAEAFVKTVTKVSASSYKLTVVDADEDSAGKGSATVKTKVGDKLDKNGNVATYGLVEPKANAGYNVEKVMIRYLGHNQETGKADDHYTYEEVPKNRHGQYLFLLQNTDVEVMVTFGKGSASGQGEVVDLDADDLEDAFELPQMFQDAADGIAGNVDDDDDDFVIEGGADNVETHTGHTLEIPNSDDTAIKGGGKIVTWKTNDKNENLSAIWGAQKIRFVPNPDERRELKSLTVIYTHTVKGEDGKEAEVTEKVTVRADEQGRYIFTVPDDLTESVTFTVNAEFGDASDGARQPVHKQLTGALAIGVTSNTGVSRIESGSQVTARGAVDLFGFTSTYTNTQADGTAITPTSSTTVPASESEPVPVQKQSYDVSGANVALKVNGSLPGTISNDVTTGTNNEVNRQITFKPNTADGISKVRVAVTYYTSINASLTKGVRKTEIIELGTGTDAKLTGNATDGYVFKFNYSDYSLANGTTVNVTFLCEDSNGNVIENTSEAPAPSQYLVTNPIRTEVNQLKTNSEVKELGRLTFDQKIVYVEGKPVYFFTIHENAGYKCDPLTHGDKSSGSTTTKSDKNVLYASWTGANGSEQKMALVHYVAPVDNPTDPLSCGPNQWYFKPSDGNVNIPAGAIITIHAVFSEDTRDVNLNYEDTNPDGATYGTAKLSKTSAKQDDKIIVTLEAKDGWCPVGVNVFVRTSSTGGSQAIPDANIVNKGNGQWEITVPAFNDPTQKLFVTPLFNSKNIELKNGGNVDFQTSESDGKAAKGQTVTIMPKDEDFKNGKKLDLNQTTVTYQSGSLKVNEKGEFTVPKESFDATELTITAVLKDKDYEIRGYTADDGKIEPACNKVDAGETVTLNIVPLDGYHAKPGTVKAEVTIKSNGGSVSTQQVIADWTAINTYTLKIPALGSGETITDIQISGEFEKGTDGVALSLGVAVAVGVTQAENILEIQGKRTIEYEENGERKTREVEGAKVDAGDLSMVAASVASKATTEAKAGFNSGETGVAGAFAIQVAKTRTDAAVRKGVDLKNKGSIFMLARNKQDFQVTGDASGKQDAEASGTGVGAGIAVAVDGLETNAVVEDGVVLTDSSNITDITLSIEQKYKDQVTAKAGATGGSAWVPVAAVDVFTSRARAELGKLRQKTGDVVSDLGTLNVNGSVTIKASSESARVQYNHEVVADASARGGGTAMGGAFIVTWLENDVQALLRQGLNAANDISVIAIAGDALKATATAAASGGNAGKKDSKGGSSDKQANKILKGAGAIAGRAGMDGASIKNGANDRQKAETAEESIAGAGAFILNVMKNKARAEIVDGVNVTTKGKLSVNASNRTDATVIANASTTKSTVGVGIGVAINIVTMENIARIGNGNITANELEVIAEIAKAPTRVRNVTIAQNSTQFKNTFTKQITQALAGLLGDNFAWAADIVGPAVGSMADTLIKDLNLEQLFKLVGSDAGGTFENFGKTIWERVKALPMVLFQPLLDLYHEAYRSGKFITSDDGLKKILENAWSKVTKDLAGNAIDTVKMKLIGEGLNKVAGSVIDMVTAKVTGKGVDGSKVTDAIKDTVVDALKDVLDKVIESTVRDIGAQLPLLNEKNITLIQQLKKTSWDDIKKSIVPFLTTTFRETVWDYAPVVEMIQKDGFVDTLKNELRKTLKNGAVAMTNEAIDKVLGVLDVKFEREAIEDRHIITTQAIAGAGAKSKSGAGSLAIAVANLTTTAEIAGSDTSKVNVAGDMTVTAEEVRRVRTHSTAAVDARGEADNNEGAGDSDKANTGGSTAATTTATDPEGNVTVTTGVGGSVAGFGSLSDDDIDIEAQIGYCLEEGNVVRTYSKPDGTEVVDKLSFASEKYDDGTTHYYFDPMDGVDTSNMTEEDIANLNIHIDVEFTELLYKLPKAQNNSVEGAEKYNGEITLSVEGREQKDTDYGAVWARYQDLGEINIPTQSGLKVKSIVVSSKDTLLTFGSDEDEDEITLASSNDQEEVYVFKVPQGQVDMIHVVFETDDDEQRVEGLRKAEKDRAGRSIGVGAAFTLTYGKSQVTAEIGKRAEVAAGTLAVIASSEHEEENYATAGTDPFEGTSDDTKDFSLDAAVSVNILDNDVKASIGDGIVKTTGSGHAETEEAEEAEEEGEDEPEEIQVNAGDLIVSATEVAGNETKASAFAAGSSTAVGAAVAVNVSISEITAELNAAAQEIAGKAVVRTHTLSQDDTWAFASAMGADIQRNLNKFADVKGTAQEKINGVTSGSIYDKKEETKSTDTNARINDRLNKDGVKQKDGDKARNDASVSTNVMRSQKVQVDNAEDSKEGTDAAKGFVKTEGGQDVDAFENSNKKSTLQVAAAVGVTVGLHKATTTVSKVIKAAKDVIATATNASNYNTRSTGTAMTLAKGKGKTIAAAVGVSVNKNEAHVQVNGDLTASDGDITVQSNLRQNQTDTYRGRLAVQSIAGSVSGKGSDASVAGAISMLFSYGKSDAVVDGNLTGNNVSVVANDKSKLAVRAGGINVSKGANMGMGVSVATIWSEDEVKAELKDGHTVDADSFALKAVKAPVTWDDYKFPLDMQYLISDSSALDDKERENVYPGLIDVHKKPGDKNYTVEINFDTYKLMKAVDALNFLSSKNYYTEAIAGSLVTGSAGNDNNALNAAGSISIVRALNKVDAILGNNVTINKKGKKAKGDVTVLAQDDSTVRMLGGAIAAGKANTSAGVTITFLYDKDEARAKLGNNVNINAANVSHGAVASTNVESFNAAASVNAASNAKASVGGGVEVVLLKTIADAAIGDNATIDAGGKLNVTSDSNLNLLLIAASASVAKSAVAAGGTIAVLVNDAKATTTVGADHSLKAVGDVTVAGRAVDKLISVIASASAAANGKSAGAGSLNVLVDNAKGLVTLGAGGTGKGIASSSGSVSLLGETETRVTNITVAAAGGKSKAIGLSANINVLQRESGVNVAGGADYTISAARDVLLSSYGLDVSRAMSFAVAASKDMGIGGNLPVLVSRNTVKTTLGNVAVNAGGEAAFASRLDDTTKAIAGSLGLSLSSNAAAATAMFVNKKNTVATDMGTSTVTAAGNAGTLAGKLKHMDGSPAETFKGIYVGAKVVDDILAVAAGIALAGKNGVTGNILWSGNSNTVKADASKASLNAVRTNADGNVLGGGSVTVNAANDSKQIVFAGGLNAAKTIAAGATAVAVTSAKDVKALAHNAKAYQDVNVGATNTDNLFEMALSAGGSGKAAVEIGIAYQSLRSKVNAVVASEIEAVTGSFNLKSNNDVNLDNTAVALAGAGKLAVTPVFAMSAFTGESNAILGGGTVKAAKGVNITATSNKNMGQYTVGASASGMAAVSGAVSVTTLKDTTNALVKNGTTITANTMDVLAVSDYKQLGASAAIAASAKAGVAVNGMVTVAKANALAEMDGAATLSGKATVKATSDRDIINAAATVAVGGQAGVGVTIMGLVAGDKMDQDAADMLTYGNSSSKKGDKTFDSSAIVNKMHEMGIKDTSDLEEKKDKDGKVVQTSLADDLAGNGRRNADASVGTNGKFDATSGVVDSGSMNGDTNANEKKEISDTADVQRARNLSNSAYTDDPKDSVVARIGSNGSVTAKGVDVNALQDTKADVVGATVSGGSLAGVGVSVAIAMLRSNVFATTLGTIDAKEGDVNVTAVSQSGGVMPDSDEAARTAAIKKDLGESEDSELKETLNTLKDMLTRRSIRVVGLAAAIGQAGVGVAGSVVRTDNITKATVGGSVKNAKALNVDAATDYGNVTALTMAVGGGLSGGLSAAFAVALTNGTVESNINSAAKIIGANTRIAVTTESVVKANALSVTAAVSGGVSAAAGVSVASNQLTQNTLVERGATIDMTGANGALKVKGTSATRADTFLAGVSIGSGAAGLGAAASIVKPKLNTSVGVNGKGTASLGKLASVDVLNDVTSTATANVLSVSAGGVALQGNVLLVFNDTDATAKVGSASGTLGSLRINGELGATGRSRLAAAAIGGVAAGASVAYVDVNSDNNAILDTDEFTATVTGDLTVSVGENENYKSQADAKSLAAAVGGVAVSLNAAVARNRARNTAMVSGKNGVTASTVNLNANANGVADARFYGLSVGSASVAGSVDVALNETTSKAVMKLGGALDAGLNANASVTGDTTAKMYTGSGAIYGAKVNVAVAYGRTNSIIDVEAAKGPSSGKKVSVNAKNNGKDDVTTTIDNQSFEALSVAAMVGTAYSQDVYNTRVKLGEGEYDASKVSVTTDYDTTATATVTPSAAGVDLSVAKIGVNYAGAKSTAYAGSELELAKGAKLNVEGDVAVKTTGKSETNSRVKSAEFLTLNLIGIGVNISNSDLSATQAATLRMNGGAINKAKEVSVQSLTDKAKANAAVGTSGVDEKDKDSVKISLVNVEVNSANATENLASTAAILGSGRDANTIAANALTLQADTGLEDVKDASGKVVRQKNIDTEAKAKSTSGTEIGLVSGGGLLAKSASSDSFNAVLSGVTANIAGDANLTAATHTESGAAGSSPGNWTLLEVSVSEMEARVGSKGDMQTSKVLIGDNTTLTTTGAMNIAAQNNGNAYTDLNQAAANSIVGIKVCKLPTESWYDTGVSIGKNAVLSSDTTASIATDSNAAAKSKVVSDGVGLAIDVSYTKGENTVNSDNNLDVGDGASITAEDDLMLSARSSAQMNAETSVTGGGALAGEFANATNTLERANRVIIGDGAELTSNDGELSIISATGEKDDIKTKAKVDAGGAFIIGRANATANLTNDSEIIVGQDTMLTASEDLNLLARATGHSASGGYGINTDASAKAKGLSILINPEAKANTTLNYNTYIGINRDSVGSKLTTQLMSNRSDVNVLVDNEGMQVYSHSISDGDSAMGWSTAESVVEANLGNTIWVDSANLYSRGTTRMLASNAGDGDKPVFDIEALAEMYAAGDSNPLAKLTGLPFNQIRSYNTREVRRKAGKFTHIAINPRNDVSVNLTAKEANLSTGFSTKRTRKKEVLDWEGAKRRCDFCTKDKGEGVGVSPSDRTVRDSVAKALSPLNDIQRMLKKLGISKARYGEEDYLAAGKIFVLELTVPLEKDVTLNNDRILKYRLWTSTATQMDTFLLPNAMRMYGRIRRGDINLQYVAEVINGDVRGDGESHDIDIITALTVYAARHPIIPVGSTGALDFTTGTLNLPARADFELYLHEISSAWLLDQLGSGFIRMLAGDQEAVNDAATNGTELPNGALVAGLVTGGEQDGWQIYWLPDSPETAHNPDQTLVCLMVNPETDEVDAFRTSLAMIENDEAPVDVSLYLYRDSKSDRMGFEKYNALFFDTPEGEKSLVKVVTDVLDGRQMVMPKSLNVVLRGFEIEGADFPVYSLTDHFFALCDGTDGQVSMFEDFYTNTFDGNTFESDYVRIEGIMDGDLDVTLKEGQPIWPEWTGGKTATDIAGNDYVRIDSVWYNEEEAPDAQKPDGSKAA